MPYFPPVQSINDFSTAKCLDILHRALGTVNIQIDVNAVKTWTMSAQVAEHFQVCIQPRCTANTTECHCSCTHVLNLLSSAAWLIRPSRGLQQL